MAVNEIPCLENVGPVDSDTRSLEEKCNIKHLESESDKDGLQPEESDETETMETQVPEAGPNTWRQCPKVCRKFSLILKRKQWNKIRPLQGCSKLRKPWTLFLYECFKEKNQISACKGSP